MADSNSPCVAIVDYGLGNLFSIDRACTQAGLQTIITSSHKDIRKADAVILPGVGAFGDAMASLNNLDLASPLKDISASGKPFMGVCLGMQLLMSESSEFGHHEGLGLINGQVNFLGGVAETQGNAACPVKVPQVGWNRINQVNHPSESAYGRNWESTLLGGLTDGEYMYFVHSYHVVPQDSSIVVSTTQYGDLNFCSSLMLNNIWACQFHPERSGLAGLNIYKNLAAAIQSTAGE